MQYTNKNFIVIAGPCAIESRRQVSSVARFLNKEGVGCMRGGIYKMRTHADSFQGLGEKALPWIMEVKKKYSLKFVSEITDPRQIESLINVVDTFQVGTRNMFNYELLKELGTLKTPVILKRGFAARIKEWLAAAEYLIKGGNKKIILCERGIRTFETGTRNTLDLAGALLAKKESNLPVIVDPSHATGRAELISPIALAAAAAGLNGIIVEVHPSPKDALSDSRQSLSFMQFKHTMKQLKHLLPVMGKKLS